MAVCVWTGSGWGTGTPSMGQRPFFCFPTHPLRAPQAAGGSEGTDREAGLSSRRGQAQPGAGCAGYTQRDQVGPAGNALQGGAGRWVSVTKMVRRSAHICQLAAPAFPAESHRVPGSRQNWWGSCGGSAERVAIFRRPGPGSWDQILDWGRTGLCSQGGSWCKLGSPSSG